MLMLSPLLVADQAVIDELLGMVDEVLTGAERDWRAMGALSQ